MHASRSALSWRRGEHALLFTLSGGLSPPPVLGAESTRTSSKQVCCPLLVPSALPHSTLIRRLRVHTRCLIHFCVRFRLLLWRIEEPQNISHSLERASSSSTSSSGGRRAVLPVWARHDADSDRRLCGQASATSARACCCLYLGSIFRVHVVGFYFVHVV